MDTITKAMLFDGKAIVTIINAKEIAQTAKDLHQLDNHRAEVLGRVLAIAAFLSNGMKGASLKMSLSIDGDGSLGKIIACGVSGGLVRGVIKTEDNSAALNDDGTLNLQKSIGNGTLTVIKDFGLKEPYVGKCELLRGDIDSDFAYYFTTSEQLPSAISSGCEFDGGNVSACGAIIIQPMPNCDDHIITILQDIATNFVGFGSMLVENSPEEIIEKYFGHFECKLLDKAYPKYVCNCSMERMENIIKSLGYDEAKSIIDERGEIEIHCDFCNTYYKFNMKDIKKLFGR